MSKFIVRAVQVITQNVLFEVTADSPERAACLVQLMDDSSSSAESVVLDDAEDEVVLQNIVCEVEEVK